MMYTEFTRPHGSQLPKSIELDERSEKLWQIIRKHSAYQGFSYEDCGGFINLCCSADVDVSEPFESGAIETMDVVSEIVRHNEDIKQAWAMTIAKAADYFNIHIPDE